MSEDAKGFLVDRGLILFVVAILGLAQFAYKLIAYFANQEIRLTTLEEKVEKQRGEIWTLEGKVDDLLRAK